LIAHAGRAHGILPDLPSYKFPQKIYTRAPAPIALAPNIP